MGPPPEAFELPPPGELPRCPRCQTPAMMGQLFCRSCGFALDLSPAEATTKAVAAFFMRPDGSPSAHVPDDDVLATVVNVAIPAEVPTAGDPWADAPTSASGHVMAAHGSSRKRESESESEGEGEGDGSEDSTIPVPAKMRALAAQAEAAARAASAPRRQRLLRGRRGLQGRGRRR
ncbi:MAG: hypothetical protein MUF34_00045 [Polyangiaceae bacterium]|nr:hypothetical protein [Polyangiaceae bacterium]